jgi:hypothetical protein
MGAVNAYANELKARGLDVNIFDGSNISPAARDQFAKLQQIYPWEKGGIPNDVVRGTLMYQEDMEWTRSLQPRGFTVVDIGAVPVSSANPARPWSAWSSAFYNDEIRMLWPAK